MWCGRSRGRAGGASSCDSVLVVGCCGGAVAGGLGVAASSESALRTVLTGQDGSVRPKGPSSTSWLRGNARLWPT